MDLAFSQMTHRDIINPSSGRIGPRWEATRAPRWRHTASGGIVKGAALIFFMLVPSCDKSIFLVFETLFVVSA